MASAAQQTMIAEARHKLARQAAELEHRAKLLRESAQQPGPLAPAHALNRLMPHALEAGALAVEIAIRSGISQRATADALGVPPSTLAGARAEFADHG